MGKAAAVAKPKTVKKKSPKLKPARKTTISRNIVNVKMTSQTELKHYNVREVHISRNLEMRSVSWHI